METNNEVTLVQDNGPVAALVRLQKEVGYERNVMNLVALLGMFGEAGEVLSEVTFEMSPKAGLVDAAFLDIIKQAKSVAAQIDQWKKEIREKNYVPQVIWTVEPDFKKELADQFYYTNALATGAGTNIFELAVIVMNKVRTKMLSKPIDHANQ